MFGHDNIKLNCTSTENTAPVTRSTTTEVQSMANAPTATNDVIQLVLSEVNQGSLRYLQRSMNGVD